MSRSYFVAQRLLQMMLVVASMSILLCRPALAAGDAIRGAAVFKRCQACHSAADDTHSTGPSLRGVMNRRIASVPGYQFSPALRGVGGSWSEHQLDLFLQSPQQFAKGTRMAFGGLKRPADRADVIAYLQSPAATAPKK